MSLEARKFLQDRIGSSIESLIQSTNAGMSPENANELIRKGAAIAAASEELGLSDEDVENMVMGRIKQDMMGRRSRNKYTGNRQSDPARRERLKSRGFGKQERRPARIGSAQDAMAVAERLNAALAPTENPRSAVTGRGDLRTAEIGKLLEESEYPDPFGQDQGQYMDYRPDDRQYFESIAQGLREEAREMESGKVDFIDGTAVPRLKPMADPARYDEINMLLDEDAYNRERGTVAPPSVLQDALSRLNAASTEQAGVADAIGRLEDDLPGAPSVRNAQQALVRDMIRADRQTFDPQLIAANNEREAYRAGVIGRDLFTAGGRGAIADEALARIGQINRLGTVKEGTRNLGVGLPGATVGNMPMANNMNGIYVDPRTGQPIAAQKEVPVALAGANTPNSLQMLNAPNNLNTREFIATQSQAEQLFEPGFQRQLNLTGETTLFADRLRGAQLPGGRGAVLPGMQGSGSTNVRSIGELDRALSMFINKGKEGGVFFPAYEEGPSGNMQQSYRTVKTLNSDGSVGRVRRQPVSDPNPGPMSALGALGYNPGEMTRLSQAMATIDAARRSSVNQQSKDAYFGRQPMGINTSDVNFNSPAQMGIKATVRDDDYQLGYTNIFKNIPGASRDATSGIYGQVMVPDSDKPGKMKPEEVAGPRTKNPDYKYIYKRGGMGSGDELEANLIAKRLSQGADMDTARQNARDARRAETNAIEAERNRRERMADPTPPPEPSSYSDPGYGDRLRLATQREKESQDDMALSTMIQGMVQRNKRRY